MRFRHAARSQQVHPQEPGGHRGRAGAGARPAPRPGGLRARPPRADRSAGGCRDGRARGRRRLAEERAGQGRRVARRAAPGVRRHRVTPTDLPRHLQAARGRGRGAPGPRRRLPVHGAPAAGHDQGARRGGRPPARDGRDDRRGARCIEEGARIASRHEREPRGAVQGAGTLRPRPHRGCPPGQARPRHRPGRGDPSRHPGAQPPDEEQPGAHR